MIPRLWTLPLLAFLLGVPAGAQAQGGGNSCDISVTGVAFGTYNVFGGAPLQSTGTVSFRCGPAVSGPVLIKLSTGQSGTFLPRTLTQSTEALAYNLYKNAARTQVWGDESGGVTGVTLALQKNTWVPVDVFAEIPPLQDVRAGTYTDTITATIEF